MLSTFGELLDLGHRINLHVKTLDITNMENYDSSIPGMFTEVERNIGLLKSLSLREDNTLLIANLESTAAEFKNDALELIYKMEAQATLYKQHQDSSGQLISRAVELRNEVMEGTLKTAESFSGTSIKSIIKDIVVVFFVVTIALLSPYFSVVRLLTH